MMPRPPVLPCHPRETCHMNTPPPDYLIPLDTASIIDSLQSSTNISAGSRQHDAQTPRLDIQAFVDSLYGPNNTSPGSGRQHAVPRIRHIPHVAANENLPADYLIPLPSQPTATRRLLSPEFPQGQDSSRGAMVYRLYPAQSETDH